MTKSKLKQSIRGKFFERLINEWGTNTSIDSDGGGRWQIDIEGYETFELSAYGDKYYIDSYGSIKGKPRKAEHDSMVIRLQDLLDNVSRDVLEGVI